jgi:hypothetical protein
MWSAAFTQLTGSNVEVGKVNYLVNSFSGLTAM